MLDKYFCDIYYPADALQQGLPPCEAVRDATVASHGRALPTLELGDAHKPALVFIHGWPDSAAEFAAQFGGFCYGPSAKYRCVAVTLVNLHPDFPNPCLADSGWCSLEWQVELVAATMRDIGLAGTTIVLHDWGCMIGFRLLNKHPGLVARTVAFDVGFGGDAVLVVYAFEAGSWYRDRDTQGARAAAIWWDAPCLECATWRSAWLYCPLSASTPNVCGNEVDPFFAASLPPLTKPLFFIWGNQDPKNAEGVHPPRREETKFFNDDWVVHVESTPYGKVLEGPGDHWINHRNPSFSNNAIKTWLDRQGG